MDNAKLNRGQSLLNVILEIDSLARTSGPIPDSAMNLMTGCWSGLIDQLIALQAKDIADVAAKFDLLANIIRGGDIYTFEQALLESALADLDNFR